MTDPGPPPQPSPLSLAFAAEDTGYDYRAGGTLVPPGPGDAARDWPDLARRVAASPPPIEELRRAGQVGGDVSAEAVRRYERERAEYEEDVRAFWRLVEELHDTHRRSVPTGVVLLNGGAEPVEGVSIYLTFPSGVVVRSPEEAAALPDPPEPPVPLSAPADRARKRFARTSRAGIAARNAGRDAGLDPLVAAGWRARAGQLGSQVISRHVGRVGPGVHLDPQLRFVIEFPSWEQVEAFAMGYEIRASGTNPVHGALAVSVARLHVHRSERPRREAGERASAPAEPPRDTAAAGGGTGSARASEPASGAASRGYTPRSLASVLGALGKEVGGALGESLAGGRGAKLGGEVGGAFGGVVGRALEITDSLLRERDEPPGRASGGHAPRPAPPEPPAPSQPPPPPAAPAAPATPPPPSMSSPPPLRPHEARYRVQQTGDPVEMALEVSVSLKPMHARGEPAWMVYTRMDLMGVPSVSQVAMRARDLKPVAQVGRLAHVEQAIRYDGDVGSGVQWDDEARLVRRDLPPAAFLNLYDFQVALAALPLAPGWEATVHLLRQRAPTEEARFQPLPLRVVGEERVTVPCGTFECWVVAGDRSAEEAGLTERYWVQKGVEGERIVVRQQALRGSHPLHTLELLTFLWTAPLGAFALG